MKISSAQSALESAQSATHAALEAAQKHAAEAAITAVDLDAALSAAADEEQRARLGHPTSKQHAPRVHAAREAHATAAARATAAKLAHDAAREAETRAQHALRGAVESAWPAIEARLIGELRAAWRHAAGLHATYLRARMSCGALKRYSDSTLGEAGEPGSLDEVFRSAGLSMQPFAALASGTPAMSPEEIERFANA